MAALVIALFLLVASSDCFVRLLLVSVAGAPFRLIQSADRAPVSPTTPPVELHRLSVLDYVYGPGRVGRLSLVVALQIAVAHQIAMVSESIGVGRWLFLLKR
jgi:hypothetical protein